MKSDLSVNDYERKAVKNQARRLTLRESMWRFISNTLSYPGNPL